MNHIVKSVPKETNLLPYQGAPRKNENVRVDMIAERPSKKRQFYFTTRL